MYTGFPMTGAGTELDWAEGSTADVAGSEAAAPPLSPAQAISPTEEVAAIRSQAGH
jgi:hypothetical protein